MRKTKYCIGNRKSEIGNREDRMGRVRMAVLFLGALFLINTTSPLRAEQPDERRIAPIVASAEAVFKAMKAGDYPAVWSRSSMKSRTTISEEVYKKIRDSKKGDISSGQVEKDFAAGGPLAQSYWNAFLLNFNPDSVLEQSTWEMGPVKEESAEIWLFFKKSENPAKLKMLKEGGQWKVGLVETFWGRK